MNQDDMGMILCWSDNSVASRSQALRSVPEEWLVTKLCLPLIHAGDCASSIQLAESLGATNRNELCFPLLSPIIITNNVKYSHMSAHHHSHTLLPCTQPSATRPTLTAPNYSTADHG